MFIADNMSSFDVFHMVALVASSTQYLPEVACFKVLRNWPYQSIEAEF